MTSLRQLSLAYVAALVAITFLACTGGGDAQDVGAGEPAERSSTGRVPMFRGNPAHTGVHPGPGPSGPPALLWRFETGLGGATSPAVVDGVVYASSFDDYLYTIGAEWSALASPDGRRP